MTLTIDIAVDGRVSAVAVKTSAGHGFDEAAVAAAREMEFTPAEVDGKPSPIRIEYTIHFQPKTVPVDAGTSDAGAPDAGAPDAASSAFAGCVVGRARPCPPASWCAAASGSAERAIL